MEIHFAAKSDIGRVRSANEDSFLHEKLSDEEYIFIVADGMGGHQAGDVASSVATKTFFEIYQQSRKKNKTVIEAIQSSILRVNAKILKMAADDLSRRGMGTTFTALVIFKMRGYIVHVGDSRLYLIRQGRLQQLTTDHSFVEKLVENGQLTKEEAREHPQKNVLYMSIGAKEGFAPEYIFDFEILNGDTFLICSDGLTNMVADDQLLDILAKKMPEDAVEALVALANENGGTDNITAQVISVGSWKTLEKTDPQRVAVRRSRFFVPLLLTASVAAVVFVYLFYFHTNFLARPGSEKISESTLIATEKKEMARIELQPLNVINQDIKNNHILPVILVNGNFYYLKNNELSSFSFHTGNFNEKIGFSRQNIVPFYSFDEKIYWMQKNSKEKNLSFKILSADQKTILTLEKNDGLDQLRSAKIINVPDLSDDLQPLYADNTYLLLRNSSRLFIIKEWLSDDSILLAGNFIFSGNFLIGLKNLEGRLFILVYEEEMRYLTELSGDDFRQIKKVDLDLPAGKLLNLEKRANQFFFYFPDRFVVWDGKEFANYAYLIKENNLLLKAVYPDLTSDLRIGISENGEIFKLEIKND